MGDRTFWFEDCPQCHGKDTVEYYDHFSAITYAGHCSKCGWQDPHAYYETDEHTVQLLTPEEYAAWQKETGLVALNALDWPKEYKYYMKTGDRTVAGLAKLKADTPVTTAAKSDSETKPGVQKNAKGKERQNHGE